MPRKAGFSLEAKHLAAHRLDLHGCRWIEARRPRTGGDYHRLGAQEFIFDFDPANLAVGDTDRAHFTIANQLHAKPAIATQQSFDEASILNLKVVWKP